MSAAYRLLTLHGGIADLRLLFEHQSRATREAFGEALHHWADPLGQRFSTAYLDPQTRLFGPTREGIELLARALESAVHHSGQVERHLHSARIAAHDVHEARVQAARLAARAQELTALARARRNNAESCAHSIAAGLNALGPPPM